MTEDVTDNAPSYFLAENVAGEGDAPEWYKADKYKTVADQAKAYVEAEKSLGQMRDKIGKFTGAPEQYDIVVPEGVSLDTEDPIFAQAQEWARGMNINQEGFNSLVEMYSQIELAKDKAFEDQYNQEKSGIENFDSRVKNINDFLTANKMEALADLITTKAALEQFEALLNMAGKSSISAEGDSNSIPTEEEINKLMFEKDEFGRQIYGYDKERQAKVRKMLEQRVGKGYHQQMVG